ncbi:hypothetical protein [Parasitella parasitica]|uniref:alpha-L-fucosidase n=1 Tax=Parasitella parasitica TaxID=35722 RepID=A0A0B7MQL1_9FUNG|nr:hypothetical protein [Parasitella parasitica]
MILVLSTAYLILCIVVSIHASFLKNSKIIQINIGHWFNNRAFGANGDFDGVGTYFQQDSLHKSELLINYRDISLHNTTFNDNIQQLNTNDMVIPLQKTAAKNVTLGAIYMLVSSSHGPCTVDIAVTYSDATIDETTLSLPDWQDQHTHHMERYQAVQYRLSNRGQGALFNVPIYVNPTKVPVSLTLPATDSEAAMHVFAITGYHRSSLLLVSSIRPTNEWINDQHQVIQVNLHNLDSKWVQDTQVHVSSDQVRTVEPGLVRAIAPGHTQTVRVIVQAHSTFSNRIVSVACSSKGSKPMTITTTLSLRQAGQFHATAASVKQHRSPQWLKRSKFGIFIHWGLYSVPSWAPVGKSYAEWYWWRMNHKDDPAFEYHRKRYGENFEYDDFLVHWKPVEFNPDNWLRLVEKSRAKYFVFTTKHHDGIALFNTSVTNRSTMHLLQPQRDFVKELMDVAERNYPRLKRGLYFSLPEWYHPQYKDDTLGWQGPPLDPYTGQQIKYTGSRAITDFVNELQVPQFQELAGYKPDILWCDIGGIHNSSVWQSNYFNQALKSGRQVAVNDRCGDASASDFTTIEYKAVVDTPTRFWEATRGIDPFSFGYNRETAPEAYTSASDLIRELVDAVSRGGNFLLNIGPKASGQVPQPMIDRLTTIGSWLDVVGESIFDTVPYWITPAQGQLRFTASQDGRSVYVFSFEKAARGRQTIKITTPLPVQRNSTITLLNYNNTAVHWQRNSIGNVMVEFDVPTNVSNILVFKINYLLSRE